MKCCKFLMCIGSLAMLAGCGGPVVPTKPPPPSPLVAAMRKIGLHFKNLTFCQAADWKTPADRPKLVPLQEAKSLTAGFQEADRALHVDRRVELKTWMH